MINKLPLLALVCFNVLIASDTTDIDLKTAIVRMVINKCNPAALKEIKKARSSDSYQIDRSLMNHLSPLINEHAELTDVVKKIINDNPDISRIIDTPLKKTP